MKRKSTEEANSGSDSDLSEVETQQEEHPKDKFSKLYPEYAFSSMSEFGVPSVVGPGAIDQLYSMFSPRLLMYYSLFAADSAKIDFISEMICVLMPVADMKYWYKRSEVEDSCPKEHPVTGTIASSRRWTYFVQPASDIVKLVVNYRNGALVSDECEFWEACAEGVRAREKNIFTAENARTADTPAQDATKGAQSAPAASESVLAAPVYVALTDWVNWRFLKIQDHEITASPIITPFPVCEEGMRPNAELEKLLQYLCCACDITTQSGEDVQERVKQWRERVQSRAVAPV